jgi:hypothetical protein
MKHVLHILTVSFFSISSCDLSACGQESERIPTTIAYFNGMANTQKEASISLEAVADIIREDSSTPFTTELFYNPTEGVLEDLFEVFKQKLNESTEFRDRWEIFWDLLANRRNCLRRILAKLTKQKVARAEKEYNSIEEVFFQILKEKTEDLIEKKRPEALVDQFASLVTSHFAEGRAVLAVAHSQGNLFANATYEKVKVWAEEGAIFKIIHVATPTSTVGGRTYFTSNRDIVIGTLRGLFNGVLPSNIRVSFLKQFEIDGGDIFGHNFKSIYLNPSLPIYEVIKDALLRDYHSLKRPLQAGQTGLFTVTLTWEGTGDIDLHSFEPQKGQGQTNHVYYLNEEGEFGFLDIDDRDGYGPEHYFASCPSDSEEAMEGTFYFGINNYSEAHDCVVTLQLYAPLQSFPPVSVMAGPSLFEEGDSNPKRLLAFEVSKNPNYEPQKSWEPKYLISLKDIPKNQDERRENEL